MNVNLLVANLDSAALAYDFTSRKGHKPKPRPQPVSPNPTNPPINPTETSTHRTLNTIKDFFGRSISLIRENKGVAITTFVAVNFLFVKLADKVNEVSAPYLAKAVHSPARQNLAHHTLTAGIILVGNYAFNNLIQYQLSHLDLVAISAGTMVIKLLIQRGPEAWKSYRNEEKTVVPSSS